LIKFYHRIALITRIFYFSQAKNLSLHKPFPRPVDRHSDGNSDEREIQSNNKEQRSAHKKTESNKR